MSNKCKDLEEEALSPSEQDSGSAVKVLSFLWGAFNELITYARTQIKNNRYFFCATTGIHELLRPQLLVFYASISMESCQISDYLVWCRRCTASAADVAADGQASNIVKTDICAQQPCPVYNSSSNLPKRYCARKANYT